MDASVNINKKFTRPERSVGSDAEDFDFDEVEEAALFAPPDEFPARLQQNVAKEKDKEDDVNPFADIGFLDLGEEIPYGLEDDFRDDDDDGSLSSDDSESSSSCGYESAMSRESSVDFSLSLADVIQKFDAFLVKKNIPDIRISSEIHADLPNAGPSDAGDVSIKKYLGSEERCHDDIHVRDNVVDDYSKDNLSRKTMKKLKKLFRTRKMTHEEIELKNQQKQKEKDEKRKKKEEEQRRKEEEEKKRMAEELRKKKEEEQRMAEEKRKREEEERRKVEEEKKKKDEEKRLKREKEEEIRRQKEKEEEERLRREKEERRKKAEEEERRRVEKKREEEERRKEEERMKAEEEKKRKEEEERLKREKEDQIRKQVEKEEMERQKLRKEKEEERAKMEKKRKEEEHERRMQMEKENQLEKERIEEADRRRASKLLIEVKEIERRIGSANEPKGNLEELQQLLEKRNKELDVVRKAREIPAQSTASANNSSSSSPRVNAAEPLAQTAVTASIEVPLATKQPEQRGASVFASKGASRDSRIAKQTEKQQHQHQALQPLSTEIPLEDIPLPKGPYSPSVIPTASSSNTSVPVGSGAAARKEGGADSEKRNQSSDDRRNLNCGRPEVLNQLNQNGRVPSSSNASQPISPLSGAPFPHLNISLPQGWEETANSNGVCPENLKNIPENVFAAADGLVRQVNRLDSATGENHNLREDTVRSLFKAATDSNRDPSDDEVSTNSTDVLPPQSPQNGEIQNDDDGDVTDDDEMFMPDERPAKEENKKPDTSENRMAEEKPCAPSTSAAPSSYVNKDDDDDDVVVIENPPPKPKKAARKPPTPEVVTIDDDGPVVQAQVHEVVEIDSDGEDGIRWRMVALERAKPATSTAFFRKFGLPVYDIVEKNSPERKGSPEKNGNKKKTPLDIPLEKEMIPNKAEHEMFGIRLDYNAKLADIRLPFDKKKAPKNGRKRLADGAEGGDQPPLNELLGVTADNWKPRKYEPMCGFSVEEQIRLNTRSDISQREKELQDKGVIKVYGDFPREHFQFPFHPYEGLYWPIFQPFDDVRLDRIDEYEQADVRNQVTDQTVCNYAAKNLLLCDAEPNKWATSFREAEKMSEEDREKNGRFKDRIGYARKFCFQTTEEAKQKDMAKQRRQEEREREYERKTAEIEAENGEERERLKAIDIHINSSRIKDHIDESIIDEYSEENPRRKEVGFRRRSVLPPEWHQVGSRHYIPANDRRSYLCEYVNHFHELKMMHHINHVCEISARLTRSERFEMFMRLIQRPVIEAIYLMQFERNHFSRLTPQDKDKANRRQLQIEKKFPVACKGVNLEELRQFCKLQDWEMKYWTFIWDSLASTYRNIPPISLLIHNIRGPIEEAFNKIASPQHRQEYYNRYRVQKENFRHTQRNQF